VCTKVADRATVPAFAGCCRGAPGVPSPPAAPPRHHRRTGPCRWTKSGKYARLARRVNTVRDVADSLPRHRLVASVHLFAMGGCRFIAHLR